MGPTLLLAVIAPNAADIVSRSAKVTQQDWKQAPDYSFMDREVDSKHGHAEPAKTYQVLMIDGSPYNKLVAVDNVPLSKQEQEREARKLEREMDKRRNESEAERERRIAKYDRERDRDHRMLSEMVNAFQYSLAGDDTLAGHKVWILKATPKPGYRPHNREEKMLSGMQGTLWIDQSTDQWVKVEAEVVKPVSMYGFFAKVKPGTRFELDQAPVTAALWLPTKFVVNVRASALMFLNENSRDEDIYTQYRPMAQTLAELDGKTAVTSARK